MIQKNQKLIHDTIHVLATMMVSVNQSFPHIPCFSFFEVIKTLRYANINLLSLTRPKLSYIC